MNTNNKHTHTYDSTKHKHARTRGFPSGIIRYTCKDTGNISMARRKDDTHTSRRVNTFNKHARPRANSLRVCNKYRQTMHHTRQPCIEASSTCNTQGGAFNYTQVIG